MKKIIIKFLQGISLYPVKIIKLKTGLIIKHYKNGNIKI